MSPTSLWMIVLVLLLGLTPLAYALWWPSRPIVLQRLREHEPDAEGLIARCRRRTLLLTLVPLALYGLWVVQAPDSVPTSASIWCPIVVFHLAWWLGVAPLLRRSGEPGHAGLPGDLGPLPAANVRVRSATLAPRERRDFLPTWWWALPVGIFAAGAAALGWRLAQGPFEQPASLAVGIAMPLGGLGFLIGFGWWARRSATDPQDISGAIDPEALARAYDEFRRFLVRGIFGLMTAAVAVFVGAGVAVALADGDPSLQGQLGGLFGGGGGALVGILGGVFGTLASLRRLRLDRIRRHGSPDAPDPTRRARRARPT